MAIGGYKTRIADLELEAEVRRLVSKFGSHPARLWANRSKKLRLNTTCITSRSRVIYLTNRLQCQSNQDPPRWPLDEPGPPSLPAKPTLKILGKGTKGGVSPGGRILWGGRGIVVVRSGIPSSDSSLPGLRASQLSKGQTYPSRTTNL